MPTVLDLAAIAAAPLKDKPFPFFTLDRAIRSEQLDQVITAFPDIVDGGSYNIEDVPVNSDFRNFLDALDSNAFRQIICDKFAVDIMNLPMLMTLRGYSRQKDGRIHKDSTTKRVTILIYLNADWPSPDGRLRILHDSHDMDNYVEEIVPGPGSLVAFKVTDNCWHGYPAYEGTRRAIQINFLTSEAAGNKHRFFHKLSARLKNGLRKLKK